MKISILSLGFITLLLTPLLSNACLPPGPCYTYTENTPWVILFLVSVRDVAAIVIPTVIVVSLAIRRIYKKTVPKAYKHLLYILRDLLIAIMCMFVITQLIEFAADLYRIYTP